MWVFLTSLESAAVGCFVADIQQMCVYIKLCHRLILQNPTESAGNSTFHANLIQHREYLYYTRHMLAIWTLNQEVYSLLGEKNMHMSDAKQNALCVLPEIPCVRLIVTGQWSVLIWNLTRGSPQSTEL